MGSGKSTMGPMIANCIGYGFLDLDSVIEHHHEKTIASLFNELGESGFRTIETAELRRAAGLDRTVMSTGGGIVTVPENRSIIKNSGFSVYLKLSPEVLARRLERGKGRPMLFGEDGRTLVGEALVHRIEQLIAPRSGYYESADLVVDLESRPIGENIDYVVRSIFVSAKSPI